MMSRNDVLEVLEHLAGHDIDVWLDGGWGIDALVARQTRPHGDLDLVVAQGDLPRAEAALAGAGFKRVPDVTPGLPARLALSATGERRVDLHPVLFDDYGNGWQPLGAGAWGGYPADGLAGSGAIAGRDVCCLTPELQLRHHLGYQLAESDRHDLRLLAQHFGIALPPDL